MERRRTELMRSRHLQQQDMMNRLQQSLLGPGDLKQKLSMITDGVVDFLGLTSAVSGASIAEISAARAVFMLP